MSDSKSEQINKVQISDVEKPQDSGELDHAQLDKVSGGGTYGCPSCGGYGSSCACGT